MAALLLLVLAAPARAAPPVCSDLTLDDVHLGNSVSGQLACTDPDDDPLTYVVTEAPAHGSAFVGFFDGSAAGLDTDFTFMLAELGKEAMHFQVLTRSGKPVDSGTLPLVQDPKTTER